MDGEYIAGIFGLVGAVIGSALTLLGESITRRHQDRKDLAYTAVKAVRALDVYVERCIAVAYDDGQVRGDPDWNGEHSPQEKPPNFKPEELEVEWRHLPARLMYRIFDVATKQTLAEETISEYAEHDGPPFWSDYFEQRQFMFARLGLTAARLAIEVREAADLPQRLAAEWDQIGALDQVVDRINALRQSREQHNGL